jgi:hypothetical protein
MDDVFVYLSKQLTEKMKLLEEDLVKGKASDIGEYKHACGVYRGLMIANDVLLTTKERMEESND